MENNSITTNDMNDNETNFVNNLINNSQRIWVFGYGSVLWKPGFQCNSKRKGYITGYNRVFWHGNTTHRGTEEKPGRVATLTPADGSNSYEKHNTKVWGVAYELVGDVMIRNAMDHLYGRECRLGGYTIEHVNFYTLNCNCDPIQTIVFRATPDSIHYLGPAPEHQLASQIVESEGPCGHNIEYVVLIALYLNLHIPESNDQHLNDLHNHIVRILDVKDRKMEQFVRMALLPRHECFENCKGCSNNLNTKQDFTLDLELTPVDNNMLRIN